MKKQIVPTRTYVHNRRMKRSRFWLLWLIALALPVAALAYWHSSSVTVATAPTKTPTASPSPQRTPSQQPGDILNIVSVQYFTPEETFALAKQNYGADTLPVSTGVTKITFRYLSQLPTGQLIPVYARAYLPSDPIKNLPIFAFAPGTTGIGDACAASLENIKVANWGDYDSHMAMYASQGYAAVTTDYEGMRDPNRIHHYMVGVLEGRAVLDSIRALERLPQAQNRLDPSNTFLGGYSQGGHAAFWADKIAATYAPSIKPKGVVGFGPVMSVSETLTDIMHGANIDWFGPYVLYSYADYYKTPFPINQILQPKYAASLDTAVPTHCIDTDLIYWGHIPSAVYTPEFTQAMSTDQIGVDFPQLQRELDENAVGEDPTPSAKLINSGAYDNVVLPAQQKAEAQVLCSSSKGPVDLSIYPKATHYDTMVLSLSSTLAWMKDLQNGTPVTSTCSVPPTASP
ncbi:MAG TPA: lipase family protein [Candidatus Saccharimonadia bacterium]|nr:lipase family protein [Candidatus Saccharimonadia bacterium]